jgi:rhamnose transport system permease protein
MTSSSDATLSYSDEQGTATWTRYVREISVAAAYLLLLSILAVFTPRYFQAKFAASWVDMAPVLVAAVGMTLVILARHIDISIGSQFAICGVVAGLLARTGLPMPAVALCTIACGAAMGAVNGIFVALMGLPSIVVTLATMVILREGLRWGRQGAFVQDLPRGFQWFGQSQFAGQVSLVATALIILAIFAWAMRWLAAGRSVYAVGSDQEAARLAGVRPKRVVFNVFMLMGALTGLAALLGAVRFPNVDPNVGQGLELNVIAAVVVGGVAISGGRGTLIGTLIGVALLGTIGSALVFLDPHHPGERSLGAWERAIQGLIILVAVASDGLGRRKS